MTRKYDAEKFPLYIIFCSFCVFTTRTQTLPYSSFRALSSPLPKSQTSSFFAKTLCPAATSSPSTVILLTFNARGSLAARCISSFPTLKPEMVIDWNDDVSCSEVGDGDKTADDGTLEEGTKHSIPVRAFFFSTSVDLRGLVEQNKQNFIPPTSRMTNYVVLKFGDLPTSPGPVVFISESDCCFLWYSSTVPSLCLMFTNMILRSFN